ncbi:MAG: DUF1801 domain-containing protein [Bacteroidetes bacterium]|nr:DUF1801 domain-containing protein [Bacteroidota bacterium]
MNKNPEVDKWLANYNNPMKEVVMAVRDVILSANAKITEDIKWSAPNFIYKGNMATFFPKAKINASLMFHKGAFIKDDSGLLEGDKPEGRAAKFFSLEDLEAKKADLTAIVNKWIEMQDEG